MRRKTGKGDPMDLDRVPSEIRITGSTCNRVRDQIDADMWAWERLMEEIHALAAKPEYAGLRLTVHERH